MEGPVRKRALKEKPSASENDDGATQSNENMLNTNNCLTYDILRIVFQYLNARDLESAAMVCRFWLEAANNEKWTRGPSCFLLFIYHKTGSYTFNRLRDIKVKPSAGFFFIPEKQHCMEESIQAALPDHCKAIVLYSRGIVMDNEMEFALFPTTVCALLPQIPNVKVKLFKLAQQCSIKSAEYREIMSTIVSGETSRSNYDNSTCFMLFCNYAGHSAARRWARAIQKSKENEIDSVWGGVLPDIYAQDVHANGLHVRKTEHDLFQRVDVPYCITVLITGHIQTWSMILERECITKEQVEAKLKLFKDEVKLKRHSVGFMFACIARGSKLYKETDVESSIFKRLFPKVPLVGCFGNGEFGKTTAVKVNEKKNTKENRKCKKLSKSWYNEFSTVFLILTYG